MEMRGKLQRPPPLGKIQPAEVHETPSKASAETAAGRREAA